jgi:hypothetical protein
MMHDMMTGIQKRGEDRGGGKQDKTISVALTTSVRTTDVVTRGIVLVAVYRQQLIGQTRFLHCCQLLRGDLLRKTRHGTETDPKDI